MPVIIATEFSTFHIVLKSADEKQFNPFAGYSTPGLGAGFAGPTQPGFVGVSAAYGVPTQHGYNKRGATNQQFAVPHERKYFHCGHQTKIRILKMTKTRPKG